MKKLFTILIGLALSASAMAGSGKAVISHWGAVSPHNASYVYISNITEHTVNVTVKYYDKDGNPLSPSTFNNFISGNTQLAARSTGFLTIQTGTWNYGFATISGVTLMVMMIL